MRRWTAIARATALEALSDPLALLLTAGALALAVIAPRLHYHQFGEPSRMAREAGLSAILVAGLAYVIFCTVKTIRREIESGTAQMALSHPVSRTSFLTAKVAGVYAAYMCFFATVFLASLTAVRGSEIGGAIAAQKGGLPLMWGPSFALATATLVLPWMIAAGLNRFLRFRFVPTAALTALAVASAGPFYMPDYRLALRYVAVASLLAAPAAVFAAVAGAAAVRLRENAAAGLSFAVAAVSLPVLSGYYVPNALSKGGSIGIGYAALGFAAAILLTAAALAAGSELLKGRDIA